MSDETKDWLYPALAWVVIVAIGLGLFFGSTHLIGRFTCNRYGRVTGREVRTELPGACYVRTDNGWFTIDQVRDDL